MYPEQPEAPHSANPYQFITDPPKTPKRKLIPGLGGGTSLAIKFAVLGVAVVVLLFIVGIVANTIFGSKTNITEVVALAQIETETLRVAHQDEKLVDQNLRNAAATTASTIESHRQIWISFLLSHGRKMSDKDLALKASSATDTKLAAALQSNGYDITFSQTIHSQLTTYTAQLKTAYNTANNTAEKNTIKSQLKDTQTLLKQWP